MNWRGKGGRIGDYWERIWKTDDLASEDPFGNVQFYRQLLGLEEVERILVSILFLRILTIPMDVRWL